MQIARRIIKNVFPRVTVLHLLEYLLSLVFEYIGKIPVIKAHSHQSVLNPVFRFCDTH